MNQEDGVEVVQVKLKQKPDVVGRHLAGPHRRGIFHHGRTAVPDRLQISKDKPDKVSISHFEFGNKGDQELTVSALAQHMCLRPDAIQESLLEPLPEDIASA